MDMSAGLASDLTRLTEALAYPETDVAGLVRSLHDTLTTAISSALGLSITVQVGGVAVCVSTLDRGGPSAGTSLEVPLSLWSDIAPETRVVLYAATPGALVDLAADLGWLLGYEDVLTLDAHLPPRRADEAITGLHELSVIHQAFGVLITRGRSPEAAREELDQAAIASETTVDVIAERLIRGLRPANPPLGR